MLLSLDGCPHALRSIKPLGRSALTRNTQSLIFEKFHISLHESTVSHELKALEFSKTTARPHHQGQNDLAIEAFKNFPSHLEEVRAGLQGGKVIEIWWQGEAKVGQKTKITWRWARCENHVYRHARLGT